MNDVAFYLVTDHERFFFASIYNIPMQNPNLFRGFILIKIVLYYVHLMRIMRRFNIKNFRYVFYTYVHEAQQESIKCCKALIFIQQIYEINNH